jgi:hypothetical protein
MKEVLLAGATGLSASWAAVPGVSVEPYRCTNSPRDRRIAPRVRRTAAARSFSLGPDEKRRWYDRRDLDTVLERAET